MGVRTVGVEEELLLVDPLTGAPLAVAGSVLRSARRDPAPQAGALEPELMQEQIETGSRPLTAAGDLLTELRRCRAVADRAAQAAGARLVASGTSPLPVDPRTYPKDRYLAMADRFGGTAVEQLTCGCHVHVAVDSPDEGVGVLDRIRPWLAPLLAVSANSPFWQGRDSGYASFRSQVWRRWPTAGPTELFGDLAGYRAAVDGLLATDAALDGGMVYFDARLGREVPTVEIRVADVCLEVEDAVLVAVLARALVTTAADAWSAGRPPARVRVDALQAAGWQAARFGLTGRLVSPGSGRPAPAADVLAELVEHVRPALAAAGDEDLVRTGLSRVLRRGTGAAAQRSAATGDDLRPVLEFAARRTRDS